MGGQGVDFQAEQATGVLRSCQGMLRWVKSWPGPVAPSIHQQHGAKSVSSLVPVLVSSTAGGDGQELLMASEREDAGNPVATLLFILSMVPNPLRQLDGGSKPSSPGAGGGGEQAFSSPRPR